MLVIRTSQVKFMEEVARRDFVQRLREHLGNSTTLQGCWSSEHIEQAIISAQPLGITRECDVAKYCELMMQTFGSLSPEYTPKAVRNILLAHGVDGSEKLRRLAEWKSAKNA